LQPAPTHKETAAAAKKAKIFLWFLNFQTWWISEEENSGREKHVNKKRK